MNGLRLRVGWPRVGALLAGALLAGVLPLSCGGSASPGRPLSLPRSLPAAKASHVVIVVLENREISEAIGSPEAPYLDALARRFALAQRYYAVSHPSLPNYLALTGGSTFGIASDCTSCSVEAQNIVDQLEAAHLSWAAYMEGLPFPCDREAQARGYAKKHDPFLYYRDVAQDPRRCEKVLPYSRLASALRAGALPTFSWITPNLCDDGHDCGLRAVDRFLRSVVPALLSELGPKGALFITWDEGSSDLGCCGGKAAGGRVATILAGPDARLRTVVSTPFDHYSLLRTVEDMLRLPHLRLAGSPSTRPLAELFRGGRVPALTHG